MSKRNDKPMKSLMTIEQILRLALQGAAEQAPPAPDADWFRAQAAEAASQTGESVVSEPASVAPWWTQWRGQWDEVWRTLCSTLPSVWPQPQSQPGLSGMTEFGHSAGEEMMARSDVAPLGVIPARLLRENAGVEAWVGMIHKPRVSYDGRLMLRLRVERTGLQPGENVELIILTVPDRRMLGSPQVVPIMEEVPIAVELPAELQAAWREINNRKWEEVPFRFVMRPRIRPFEDYERGAARWSRKRRLPNVAGCIERLAAMVHSILGIRRARNRSRELASGTLGASSRELGVLVGRIIAGQPAGDRMSGWWKPIRPGVLCPLGARLDGWAFQAEWGGPIGADAAGANSPVQHLARLGLLS